MQVGPTLLLGECLRLRASMRADVQAGVSVVLCMSGVCLLWRQVLSTSELGRVRGCAFDLFSTVLQSDYRIRSDSFGAGNSAGFRLG